MIRKPTGRRFDFEDRHYTEAGKLREWMKRVREAEAALHEAVTSSPPKTYTAQVEVPKDDPRYEKAPLSEEWIINEDVLKITVPKI
jgi:hypothetical protein